MVNALRAGNYSDVFKIGGYSVGDFDATNILVTYRFRGSAGFPNACGRYG